MPGPCAGTPREQNGRPTTKNIALSQLGWWTEKIDRRSVPVATNCLNSASVKIDRRSVPVATKSLNSASVILIQRNLLVLTEFVLSGTHRN